jgi:hypothetical protein
MLSASQEDSMALLLRLDEKAGTARRAPLDADPVKEAARRMIAARDALEEAQAELALAHKEMVKAVADKRRANLDAGNTDHIAVSVDGRKVRISWPARFKSIPRHNEPALRDAFGVDYGRLVDDKRRASVSATADQLKNALGEDFRKIERFVKFDDALRPSKGVYTELARLRSEGYTERARDVQTFLDATAWAPNVTVER